MTTTLPASIRYPLPTGASLPAPVVAWAADPATSALLIHDMQNHFLRPFHPTDEPLSAVLAHIAQLRARAADLGVPVFYTAQPAHQTADRRALLTDFWGPGIGADEDAARIVEVLAPAPGDTVLTKWRYSAFQRTDLAARLAALGRSQLIVTGVYAHIGCAVTASDAFMGDVQPFLIADAVADFSLEHHRQALGWVAGRCGVVTTTAALLADWAMDAAAGDETRIRALLRTELAALLFLTPAEVGDHDDLVDLGLDSIRVMQLVETLRTAGVPASFDRLAGESTVHDLARSLAGDLVSAAGGDRA